MDILRSIQLKLEATSLIKNLPGTKAVLTHIQVAERYFEKAKLENENNFYTDVIYRCNHAFEGILKEAYSHFERNNVSNKTSNEIEKYLIANNVLKERVLDLFTNYRQNWRNPSTHDYKLFFSEQEAFLAIVTVSAFVSILVDQVIERLSYELERAEFESKADEIKSSIPKYTSMSLPNRVAALVNKFALQVISGSSKPSERTEPQLIGMVSGFINSVEPDYKIHYEPSYDYKDSKIRPDLVVEFGGESVLLEVKRANHRKLTPWEDSIDTAALEQVKIYQEVTKIKDAILFFYPRESDSLITFSFKYHGEEEYTIYEISPSETLSDE